MKLRLFIVLFTFMNISLFFGQELPVLSHNNIYSYLYNPSLTGSSFYSKGTITLIHRNYYSDVSGNPKLNLISGNMPLKNYKIGLGGNLFVENTNILQNIYLSAAFSYHIFFEKYQRLSFGFSSGLSYLDIVENCLVVYDETLFDPVINEYGKGKVKLDFSFGLNYESRHITIGGTVNKLRLNFLLNENTNQISDYYSMYCKFSFPVNLRRDLIEPVITYRSMPFSSPQGNLGAYYSYKAINSIHSLNAGYFIFGGSVSTNLSAGVTVGLSILKRIKLFYNFESYGKYQKYLGFSNEITIRYDIINLNYLEKLNEYQKWNYGESNIKRFINKIFKNN